MNDPKRLLEDPALSAGAAELLRAIPGPPPLGPEKLRALAHDLAGVAAAPATPTLAAEGLRPLLLKAGVLVAGAGLVAFLVMGRGPREAATPVATVLGPAAAAPALPPARPEPAPPAEEARIETPAAPSAPPASRTPSPADRLAEEEALLEKARLASSSSPAAALALLRDYQRRFPGGQLRAEQMYLLVEVLERTGDRAGAERQSRLLVERFPKSVYARRIRERKQ